MRLANDLLGGTSDLFRLLARANHFKLSHWALVATQWFAVYRARLCNETVLLQLVRLGFVRSAERAHARRVMWGPAFANSTARGTPAMRIS